MCTHKNYLLKSMFVFPKAYLTALNVYWSWNLAWFFRFNCNNLNSTNAAFCFSGAGVVSYNGSGDAEARHTHQCRFSLRLPVWPCLLSKSWHILHLSSRALEGGPGEEDRQPTGLRMEQEGSGVRGDDHRNNHQKKSLVLNKSYG